MKQEIAKATEATTKKTHINVDSTVLANTPSAFFVASNQPQTKTSTKKVPPQGRYVIIVSKTKSIIP